MKRSVELNDVHCRLKDGTAERPDNHVPGD